MNAKAGKEKLQTGFFGWVGSGGACHAVFHTTRDLYQIQRKEIPQAFQI